MRRVLGIAAAAIAAVAVAQIVAAPGPARADDHGTATLSLYGNGSVVVAPDIATVSVGVNTAGETAAAALAENTANAARVIGALKAAGVEEADIQTSNFGIQPVYSDRKYSSGDGPRIDGYRVTNMVTARMRDLDRVGAVLDGLVNSGANTINGISFGKEDDSAARDEARKLAVADALHKARLLADAAGITLGPIRTFAETGGGGPSPVQMEMAVARSAVPVQAGSLTISASVSIVWEIADGD